jgi:drug/metabolite transporter (DMT)-like permease
MSSPDDLPDTPRRRLIAGLLFGLAAALIGGLWQVATRHAVTTSLPPAELAWLRYGIPALLLAPVTWRALSQPPANAALRPATDGWRRLLPATLAPRHALFMLLGAGLPFGLVAMSGTRLAPAAHMGVLLAGATPLFASALGRLLWRERVDAARLAGLALMAGGVVLLGARSLADAGSGGAASTVWQGDALLLFAALLWSGYALAFRRSGLDAWQAAALVNTWSLMLLLPLVLVVDGARPQALFTLDLGTLAWHALSQGVVAGVLGLWTFSATVQRLGAAGASAFGALVPAISALGGWWWLDDPLGPLDVLAVAAAVAGVVLASGALALRRRAPAAIA